MSGAAPGQIGLDWRASGLVAGVDEAGRGPLAGPVVAAAVILDETRPIAGIADSKTLRHERRVELAGLIRNASVAYGIGWADAGEIDSVNILQATFLAMRRALLALTQAPAHVVFDGNRCPPLHDLPFTCTSEAVIKGDAKVACIGAASILAKVARDEHMLVLDGQYPGYGLGIHKGYPTAMHLAALRQLGPSPVHRRSFGPVQSCLPR